MASTPLSLTVQHRHPFARGSHVSVELEAADEPGSETVRAFSISAAEYCSRQSIIGTARGQFSDSYSPRILMIRISTSGNGS